MLLLLSGTGLAQLLGLLVSPIISRLYSPDDFGVFGTIMSFVGIFTVISCLRLESAIVLEKNNQQAQKLQDLSIYILTIFTICLLLIYLIAPQAYFWVDTHSIRNSVFILTIPIIFFTGLYSILYFRLNREESYKTLASTQVLRKTSQLTSQIIFGLGGWSKIGLILGSLFAPFVGTIYIFIKAKSKIKLPNKISFYPKLLRRYRQFPIFSTPQSLLNAVMAQLPIIVLAAYYPIAIVGAFFFAWKIVQLPASFMGQAVRTVFFKEAVNQKNNSLKLYQLFRKTTLALALLIALPTVLLFIGGSPIFSFVFGSDWGLAGKISSWLIIWFALNFVQSPSRTLFLVFEKQKLLLGLDFVLSIVRSIVLIIAAMYLTAIQLIALYSIVSGAFFIMTIFGWSIFLNRNCKIKLNTNA